jgi:hypothetical protein
LTEAWLEVEAERRKVAQGGRPVGQAGQVGQAGGVIPATAPGGQRSASPVRPTVVPQTIQTTASPPGHANSANSPQTGRPPSGTAEPITPRPSMQNTPVIPQDTPPPPTPGTPAGTGCGDAAPTAAGPIHPGAAGSGFPFSNAPSPPTSVPNTPIQPDSTSESNHHPDAVDTASRERIEEFKRMQRALRAHRR